MKNDRSLESVLLPCWHPLSKWIFAPAHAKGSEKRSFSSHCSCFPSFLPSSGSSQSSSPSLPSSLLASPSSQSAASLRRPSKWISTTESRRSKSYKEAMEPKGRPPADLNAHAFQPDKSSEETLKASLTSFRDAVVLQISASPTIFVAPDAVPAWVCKDLICVSKDRLKRSRVCGAGRTKERTSYGTFLRGDAGLHPAAVELERCMEMVLWAIARESGRPIPQLQGATQIIRYKRGQEYRPHMDNNMDNRASEERYSRDEQELTRPVTVLIYLNSLPDRCGGCTRFPKAEAPPRETSGKADTRALEEMTAWKSDGLHVRPTNGAIVVFYSALDDGSEDPSSLHSGDPVRGFFAEKWIATRWARHHRVISS